MDPWQRLIIHFPRKENLIQFDLPPWHRYSIIRDLALLKIRVGTDELKVLGFGFQAAAVLDDLLQADSGPFCGPNCAFCPLFVPDYQRNPCDKIKPKREQKRKKVKDRSQGH